GAGIAPAVTAYTCAAMELTDTLMVGLLGCGTVGSGVVRLLTEHADEIAARTGARLVLGPVAVRNPSRDRGLGDLGGLDVEVTSDPHAVTGDPQVDIVVEVMGGIEPARGLIVAALENGK